MRSFITFNLLAVLILTLSGCGGGDFAPVSGTVTSDGIPVGKVRVMFSPEPVENNHAVGPFSMGVTDSAGNFTLTTRYGDPGAVLGAHTAAFEYTDVSEEAMRELRDIMTEAQDEGDKAQFQEAKAKMVEMKKKLKGRPVLYRQYRKIIEIPAGGIADLKLEMSEMDGVK